MQIIVHGSMEEDSVLQNKHCYVPKLSFAKEHLDTTQHCWGNVCGLITWGLNCFGRTCHTAHGIKGALHINVKTSSLRIWQLPCITGKVDSQIYQYNVSVALPQLRLSGSRMMKKDNDPKLTKIYYFNKGGVSLSLNFSTGTVNVKWECLIKMPKMIIVCY